MHPILCTCCCYGVLARAEGCTLLLLIFLKSEFTAKNFHTLLSSCNLLDRRRRGRMRWLLQAVHLLGVALMTPSPALRPAQNCAETVWRKLPRMWRKLRVSYCQIQTILIFLPHLCPLCSFSLTCDRSSCCLLLPVVQACRSASTFPVASATLRRACTK